MVEFTDFWQDVLDGAVEWEIFLMETGNDKIGKFRRSTNSEIMYL